MSAAWELFKLHLNNWLFCNNETLVSFEHSCHEASFIGRARLQIWNESNFPNAMAFDSIFVALSPCPGCTVTVVVTNIQFARTASFYRVPPVVLLELTRVQSQTTPYFWDFQKNSIVLIESNATSFAFHFVECRNIKLNEQLWAVSWMKCLNKRNVIFVEKKRSMAPGLNVTILNGVPCGNINKRLTWKR